jgi:hypothetical protein
MKCLVSLGVFRLRIRAGLKGVITRGACSRYSKAKVFCLPDSLIIASVVDSEGSFVLIQIVTGVLCCPLDTSIWE